MKDNHVLHRGISWSRKVRERTGNGIQIRLRLSPRHSVAKECASGTGLRRVEHSQCERGGGKGAQPAPPACLLPAVGQEVISTHLGEWPQVPSLGDAEQSGAHHFSVDNPARESFVLLADLLDGSVSKPHMWVKKRFPSLSLWLQRSRNCDTFLNKGAHCPSQTLPLPLCPVTVLSKPCSSGVWGRRTGQAWA